MPWRRGVERSIFEVRTNPTEAFTGMNRDLDTMFALAGEATPVVLRLGIDERVLQRRLVALVWRNTPLYAAFVLLAVIVQIYLARRLRSADRHHSSRGAHDRRRESGGPRAAGPQST